MTLRFYDIDITHDYEDQTPQEQKKNIAFIFEFYVKFHKVKN